MQLRSGDLAAPAARCLPLLPSGSGGVHRATMRETRSSTPHEPSGAQVIGGPGRPKLLVSPGGARFAAYQLAAHRLRYVPIISPVPSPGGPTLPTRGGGVAERPGFEPGVEFPPHTLSRRAPSTARTPLRIPAGDRSLATHQRDRRYRPAPCPHRVSGGEGGIRTHVGVAPQPAFEAGPLRPLRYLSDGGGGPAASSPAPLRSA
jgi:hypothetical protein